MVEWKNLGSISEIGTGSNNREDSSENGLYPFFVRSKDILKIDHYLFDEEAILIPGEGGIGDIFHYINGKYGLHQRTYRVHPNSSTVNGRYLYYYLFENFKTYINKKSFKATATSIRKPMLIDFPVAIPSLTEQNRIVGILDIFTSSINNLDKQIEQRQKQYEYYRNKLLSFEEGEEGVEWKYIGDIFTFKNGLNKGKDFFGHGGPIINYTDVYHNNGITAPILKGKVELSPLEIGRYLVHRGDVFFTRTSETPEEVGYASVLLEEIENCTFSGFLLRGRPEIDVLIPEYCKYCFSTYEVRKAIVNTCSFTTRATTTGGTLSKIRIPIPPKSLQLSIVRTLDTFESLLTNLKKERELRQKQYEYYREKLLTFA